MILRPIFRPRFLTIGATFLATAALLAIVPRSATAQDAKFGTIKGRLVWGGAEVPVPQKVAIPDNIDFCGKKTPIFNRDLVIGDDKGIANAFAYLVKPVGKNPDAMAALLKKAASVDIDQKNCQYLPYSTAIIQGQDLVFRSSDPVGHNVHLRPFINPGFNQVVAPNGSATVKLVAERIPIALTCDLHLWMKAYIMVFDHPFFAVTKDDGSFVIEGVPAGTQNLIVRIGSGAFITPGAGKGKPVTVEAGKVTDVGDVVLDPTKVKLPK